MFCLELNAVSGGISLLHVKAQSLQTAGGVVAPLMVVVTCPVLKKCFFRYLVPSVPVIGDVMPGKYS